MARIVENGIEENCISDSGQSGWRASWQRDVSCKH